MFLSWTRSINCRTITLLLCITFQKSIKYRGFTPYQDENVRTPGYLDYAYWSNGCCTFHLHDIPGGHRYSWSNLDCSISNHVTSPSLMPIGFRGLTSYSIGNPEAAPCEATLLFTDDYFLPITFSLLPIECLGFQQAKISVPLASPNGNATVLWLFTPGGTWF